MTLAGLTLIPAALGGTYLLARLLRAGRTAEDATRAVAKDAEARTRETNEVIFGVGPKASPEELRAAGLDADGKALPMGGDDAASL